VEVIRIQPYTVILLSTTLVIFILNESTFQVVNKHMRIEIVELSSCECFFEDVKLGISFMAISKPGVQING